MHSFVLDWRRAVGVDVDNRISPDRRLDLSIANYKHGHNDDKAGIQYLGDVYLAGKYTDSEDVALEKDLNEKKSAKEKQNYTPAKWDIDKYMESVPFVNNDKSTVNWYVLRYADVLLLYAEALNEWKQGPTDEAYKAINMVRRRGFGLPVETDNSASDLSGLSYDEFQKAVRNERAYELAFEGHRRQDLVRWGIYYDSIRKTAQDLVDWYSAGDEFYVCVDYTKKNKNELLPIPQQEMDLCTQFNQNPGW